MTASLITATPTRTVDVSGPITLFDVAAAEYGDATLWTRIARANGLTDPWIAGALTLRIPPKADSNGGVLYG